MLGELECRLTLWRFVKCEPEVNFARMVPAHLLQFLPQEDVLLGLKGKAAEQQ